MKFGTFLPSIVATAVMVRLLIRCHGAACVHTSHGTNQCEAQQHVHQCPRRSDVSVGRVFSTEIEDGAVTFPVTGGAIDLDTASGNILHSGGLTLKAGNTQVRVLEASSSIRRQSR